MWLFLAFLMVPLIEIALFIQIGGWIGLWPTLAVVVLTAVAGTVLVRSQGAAVLARLRRNLETLHDPTEPLAHGAMILFSGALLLTPGFFTDAVGFLLLVPGVRVWVMKMVAQRVKIQTLHMGPRPGTPPQSGDDVIDATYSVDAPSPRSDTQSGWRRH
jgi:UPF0716 protein FxsA